MELAAVDIRQIQTFLAVAREGGFGRAADRVGFSQSAVSQQVAALEKAVGYPLFNRPGGPRAVTLTPAGEVMRLHGEAVLEQLRRASVELAEAADAAAGRVVTGSFQSVSVGLLPQIVARLRHERPSMTVVPIEINEDVAMREALIRGDLDVGFVVALADVDDERLDVRELLIDPFVLVSPAGWGLDRTVPADSINDISLVGEIMGSCQLLIEDAMHDAGITSEFVFRSSDNGAIQAMVRAETGGAVRPLLAVDTSDPGVTVSAIEPPLTPRRIGVATRRGEPMTAAVTALIEAGHLEAEALQRRRREWVS